MLAIPELAMAKSRKVTTVCNGKREVWMDYEQAKAYFLELIQSVRNMQTFVNGMKIGVFVMTYTDQQYFSRFFV